FRAGFIANDGLVLAGPPAPTTSSPATRATTPDKSTIFFTRHRLPGFTKNRLTTRRCRQQPFPKDPMAGPCRKERERTDLDAVGTPCFAPGPRNPRNVPLGRSDATLNLSHPTLNLPRAR